MSGLCRLRRHLALLVVLSVGSTGGCISAFQPAAELPLRDMLVRDQLVIHSDFLLPKQHRLFDDLALLRGDVASTLSLPTSDEPIHVHLFENSKRFNAFVRLKFPDFPARRAFFVETDTRLTVYAQWGDRIAEDLRHEVAHGYMHAVIRNLPLWLDEGLAEYFEVPRGNQGIHRAHIAELVAEQQSGDWRPDLARLEAISTIADMTQRDYAEAWAWTHWLLTTAPGGRQLLGEYLARLQKNGSASPFSSARSQMGNDPEGAVLIHIQRLAAST